MRSQANTVVMNGGMMAWGSDTLVLSAGYEVMARVAWQRAMTLWISGRVEVLEAHEDRPIRSARASFKVPAVVRFLRAHRRYMSRIKYSKENVFLRDHGQCQYCARRLRRWEATYDHVLPRSLGGKAQWQNIVLACLSCNQRKRDRTPAEAGMVLLSRPCQPRSLPGMHRPVRFEQGMPVVWRHYLGES